MAILPTQSLQENSLHQELATGPSCFPKQKGSLRSIQNGFVRKEQVIDLVVYETLRRNEEAIPSADYHGLYKSIQCGIVFRKEQIKLEPESRCYG